MLWTDRQTDRFAISRVSMLTRDKNTADSEQCLRKRFLCKCRDSVAINPLTGTLQPQNNGILYSNEQYSNWYTIPPRALVAVPNVTTHLSTVSVLFDVALPIKELTQYVVVKRLAPVMYCFRSPVFVCVAL